MPKDTDDFPVPRDEAGGEAEADKPKRSDKGWTKEARAKAAEAGRKSGQVRAAVASSGRGKSKSALLAEVRSSITDATGKGGAMLVPVFPVPGGYLVATSDQWGDAICKIAERNPAVLAWLTKTSDVMDWVQLGTLVAGLGVAVAVQFGRVSPDAMIAAQFGIPEIVADLGLTVVEGQADAGAAGDEGERRPLGVPDRLADVAPTASG